MRRIILTSLAAIALVLGYAGTAAAGAFTQTINQHNVTVTAGVSIGRGAVIAAVPALRSWRDEAGVKPGADA